MSEIPSTHVFSLDSSIGLGFFGDYCLDHLDLAASQSQGQYCFALSGRSADTWNLGQCWQSQAGDVYGSHKPIFVHLRLSVQQLIELMAGDQVMVQPGG
jgi:hypothetical protein